jgi:GNAT superfamily N-acetyltransferase
VTSEATTLRTTLRPGDVGEVIRLHGVIHHAECGFDPTFEAYVAEPLAEFVKAASPRERLWIAERGGEVVGCVAIVESEEYERTAQLRWFLVTPGERGAGLGTRLVNEALGFCREQGYETVILWTVSTLAAAARLYRRAGFVRVEEKPGRMWGVDVVEEKYELRLA